MMKSLSRLFIFLIFTFALAGCGIAGSAVAPTSMVALPTLAVISASKPTPSITPTPFYTLTPTLLDTLEPPEAMEAIRRLLQEPGDCASPCFWGITPGQTTVGEAGKIFDHFGLQMASTIINGKNYSSIDYDLDSGLSFVVILTTQNDIVESIQVKINPEKQQAETRREWAAYSPEALIERYGVPSRVDFLADWGPAPLFAMQIYFDAVDLIVQYTGDKIIPGQRGLSQICPQIVQFDSVWLWMGKNPQYSPVEGVPLEKATSMTVEEFSKMLVDDPDHACFPFDGNAFP